MKSRRCPARHRRAAGLYVSVLPALGLLSAAAGAQPSELRLECDDGVRGARGWFGRRASLQVCEIRELTLDAAGRLVVDARQNGGVQVTGWDRDDVLVRAAVRAWGRDEDEAREMQDSVEIRANGNAIRAEGPPPVWRRGRGRSWSVSYEVFTPPDTNLTVDVHNGGIVIDGVRGDIGFGTTNGGVRLNGLAGNVRGYTTNGGVDITLTGGTWDGAGLDVETTNGGVRLRVPEDYSARLEASTVNGGLNIAFPITVQGRLGRRISATLGDGGPVISVRTTNGGVHVSRD